MNGLEFTQATTAGEFRRVLVHAAPAQASIEIVDDDGRRIAHNDIDREGEYSPITLLDIDGGQVRRREVWPDETHIGLVVLIAGGEAGVLQRWEHAADHSWWRWAVEFSNHKGRPADWAPPGQHIQR
jgi:hypothetical protein